eukprot:2169969-Pyramimonas_sp.AAC.1
MANSEYGSELSVPSQASRTLEQQFGGTDWAAVMRSLAQPSPDGGHDMVGTALAVMAGSPSSRFVTLIVNKRHPSPKT